MINSSNDTRSLTLEICPFGVLYEAFRKYDDVTALYVTSLGNGAKRVEYLDVEFKVSGTVCFSIKPSYEKPFVFLSLGLVATIIIVVVCHSAILPTCLLRRSPGLWRRLFVTLRSVSN